MIRIWSGKGTAPDTVLLLTLASLVAIGLLVFSSAALGLLARENEAISRIVANQFLFGIGLGTIIFFICATIPYKTWKKLAPYLFGASVILTAFVFIPGFGILHGGSLRWLDLGFISLQPSEAIKIGLILAMAAYFSAYRNQVSSWYFGLGGFALITAVPATLLLLQPDHGTFGVVVITAGVMFVAAGAPAKQIVALVIAGILMASAVFVFQPYVRDRVLTFLDPSRDPGGSAYQIQQSLLAIGSGELTGKGLGRGIQKFQYLPEPVGDSIFAVVGEEFGFVGTSIVILLFSIFLMRGFSIATRAPDYFGGLLAIGIVTYIITQSFLNMASMLGLMPLTGIPLVFMSQGGTAMLIALGSVGILANISRYARKS